MGLDLSPPEPCEKDAARPGWITGNYEKISDRTALLIQEETDSVLVALKPLVGAKADQAQ